MKSIRANTIYNLINTIILIMIPIVTFPYTSRVIGVTNMGRLNFTNSIVIYFSLLATLGISTYGIREISKVRNDSILLDKTLKQLITLNLITTIISYFLLSSLLIFVKSLNGYELLIIIQSGNILFNVLGADWFNTAMEDFKFITIRNVAVQTLSIIAMFIFIKSSGDYIHLALISFTASIVISILNIIKRRKHCNKIVYKNLEIKRHLPNILRLFSLLLALNILNHLDITMLGFLKGPYEVGLYSTALKIINIITFAVTSISLVTMPKLSLLFSKRKYNEINQLLDKIISFTILFGLPSLVGINLIARDLIQIVAGSDYLGAVNAVHLLSISMFVMFISAIYGNMILIPSLKEKRFIVATIIAMILNVVTNFIFIPKYGIEAAALTTLLSHVTIILIARSGVEKEIIFGKRLDIYLSPIIGSILIIFVGAIGQTIQILWLRLFVILITSFIVYITTLIIFKHKLLMLFWTFTFEKLFFRKDVNKK